MSDMIVREIGVSLDTMSKTGIPDITPDKDLEMFIRDLESDFKKPKVSPPVRSKDNIIFVGPTAAEQAALDLEKASPLVDSSGRQRWISSRECYCNYDASDECKFHSKSEKGWEVCPNTPSGNSKFVKPRKLWHSNPEFGKPRDMDEVLKETKKENEKKLETA